MRVLAVTSPQVGDGKSISAVNIAAAMALRDAVGVLLVDADFRRSSLHTRLGLPVSPGFAEVLNGECSLEQAVVRVSEVTPSFYFLPAGRAARNPVELPGSERLALRCAEIRKEFDLTIIDTPPIGLVADHELVQMVSDGVILVVRPDHQPAEGFSCSAEHSEGTADWGRNELRAGLVVDEIPVTITDTTGGGMVRLLHVYFPGRTLVLALSDGLLRDRAGRRHLRVVWEQCGPGTAL